MNKLHPVLRCLFFIIFPVVSGYYLIQHGVHASGKAQVALIGGGIILLIIAFIFFLGYLWRCSSCKYWFVAERVKREELGREKGTKIKTLTDKVKNRKGETVRTIEKEVVVQIERIAYRNYMECSHCHFKWTTNSVEEREL